MIAKTEKKKKKKSMVEGVFMPLPNPIMFQFKQTELYARSSARCCSNKDVNSLDGEVWEAIIYPAGRDIRD